MLLGYNMQVKPFSHASENQKIITILLCIYFLNTCDCIPTQAGAVHTIPESLTHEEEKQHLHRLLIFSPTHIGMKSLLLCYDWLVPQSHVLHLHWDWLLIYILKQITNHRRGSGGGVVLAECGWENCGGATHTRTQQYGGRCRLYDCRHLYVAFCEMFIST